MDQENDGKRNDEVTNNGNAEAPIEGQLTTSPSQIDTPPGWVAIPHHNQPW